MKKFFASMMLAALAAIAVNAQSTTEPTTTPWPATANTTACDQMADRLVIGEWNTGQARVVCSGGVARAVYAPAVKQIVAFGDDNFVTYSMSGRLRWHTAETTWQWLLPANGRLQNEQGVGFTLTDRWENEKLNLDLWLGGYYDVWPMQLTADDYCTMSASTTQGISACVDAENRILVMSRHTDFAGHREERRIALDQPPIGTVAVDEKLYILLANEITYPPCNDPICSPTTPTSVKPAKLVEVNFNYGQADVTQQVVLDGLNVDPVTNLNRVAASKNSIYWVAGPRTILRFSPAAGGKPKVHYQAGETEFLAGLAVISVR